MRVIPPSATTSSPVMKDESSQARKSTTRAISSVVPRRPSGIFASSARCVAAAASAGSVFSMIPESVGPGADRVHANRPLRQFGCGGPRKGTESGLRGGVGAAPRHPQVRADRGVEDDGASPAEQRNSRLEREPGAFHVDAEDLVEIRFAQAREGAPADDPRVQEQDVEPAVLLGDAGEQPPDLGPSPESDATTSAIPRKLARACSSVMG